MTRTSRNRSITSRQRTFFLSLQKRDDQYAMVSSTAPQANTGTARVVTTSTRNTGAEQQ